jgi:hypothetical protein
MRPGLPPEHLHSCHHLIISSYAMISSGILGAQTIGSSTEGFDHVIVIADTASSVHCMNHQTLKKPSKQ